ncbi:Uncharacterised protein [uncultured archaeon]|nr:Uncharacterised protein [uncultured archaeon]
MNEADLKNAIYRWACETEKRGITFDAEIYDITMHFNKTESKLIRKMLAEEGTVSLGLIENAAGILSCMQSEENVGTDEFEIMARLLSNVNEKDGLQRYLIYGTELKWSKKEFEEYSTYLEKNQYLGALNKKWFVTGKNDNVGKGIRYCEIRSALDETNYNVGDLVLLSAGKKSRESLENIAATMKYLYDDTKSARK